MWSPGDREPGKRECSRVEEAASAPDPGDAVRGLPWALPLPCPPLQYVHHSPRTSRRGFSHRLRPSCPARSTSPRSWWPRPGQRVTRWDRACHPHGGLRGLFPGLPGRPPSWSSTQRCPKRPRKSRRACLPSRWAKARAAAREAHRLKLSRKEARRGLLRPSRWSEPPAHTFQAAGRGWHPAGRLSRPWRPRAPEPFTDPGGGSVAVG